MHSLFDVADVGDDVVVVVLLMELVMVKKLRKQFLSSLSLWKMLRLSKLLSLKMMRMAMMMMTLLLSVVAVVVVTMKKMKKKLCEWRRRERAMATILVSWTRENGELDGCCCYRWKQLHPLLSCCGYLHAWCLRVVGCVVRRVFGMLLMLSRRLIQVSDVSVLFPNLSNDMSGTLGEQATNNSKRPKNEIVKP